MPTIGRAIPRECSVFPGDLKVIKAVLNEMLVYGPQLGACRVVSGNVDIFAARSLIRVL